MRTRWASRAPVATLLAALTLVVAATACSDPLAPEDAAGVYVRGPGGFTYAPNDAYYRVHADTILLRADGTPTNLEEAPRWRNAASRKPAAIHRVLERAAPAVAQ